MRPAWNIAVRSGPDAKAPLRRCRQAKARTLDPADAAKDDGRRVEAQDGRTASEHTILANIPAVSTTPPSRRRCFLWLHGAVSRPSRTAAAPRACARFARLSDDEGFIVLLSPSTRKGAEWWTPNGVALIRGALEDLARGWRIDAERVAVSGFSDGASGCFHLLAHDPEPYCCFLPLMAHPGVTRLAGGPCFASNVRSRPVLAFNGGQDTLYPSARIKPLIDEVKKAGATLEWIDLEEAGHRVVDVIPQHWDKLRAFWQANPRKATPREVEWETGVPGREGRLHWIEILKVDPKAPVFEGEKAYRLPDPAGRPRLGVRVDRSYAGPGLKLESVEEGTAAYDAGFEAGDIIVALDGTKMEGAREAMMVLVRGLAKLTDRDGVFTVKRGEKTLTFKARPRAATAGDEARPKELGYGLPSGRIRALLKDDNTILVSTRHVRRFQLHLHDGMVDLSKPVTVIVNGTQTTKRMARGETSYVLQEAVRQVGGPAYRASIVVTVKDQPAR